MTALNIRTIQRILELFNKSGGVSPREGCRGRATALSSEHQRVCIITLAQTTISQVVLQYVEACIEHSPDAYLDELALQLEDAWGVKVSLSTVWRALSRMGFTRKKVRYCTSPFLSVS